VKAGDGISACRDCKLDDKMMSKAALVHRELRQGYFVMPKTAEDGGGDD